MALNPDHMSSFSDGKHVICLVHEFQHNLLLTATRQQIAQACSETFKADMLITGYTRKYYLSRKTGKILIVRLRKGSFPKHMSTVGQHLYDKVRPFLKFTPQV